MVLFNYYCYSPTEAEEEKNTEKGTDHYPEPVIEALLSIEP
jgi:hypothetical protein